MLPAIESFMTAHQLPDVTIVADAGMISEANQKDIEAAGLSFILGARIPHVPYVVAQWRREHPGQDIPDGHIFTQPWPAAKDNRRDKTISDPQSTAASAFSQVLAGPGLRLLLCAARR